MTENKKINLQAICPYFAMFPENFVRCAIKEYSNPGDFVFDPFSGRGTTVLEALLVNRYAYGCDINPVAYCISNAKADPPLLRNVLIRINVLKTEYSNLKTNEIEDKRLALPTFFKRAFYHTTLREIIFLRDKLNWKQGRIDRFIAALLIGSLHGEMNKSKSYFSNQMPRTICLKPEYSLNYWKKRDLFPKKRNVFKILEERADFRLKKLPKYHRGRVALVDIRDAAKRFPGLKNKVNLVLTSPPYLNVTSFEEDQWLRIWFLGGKPYPTYKEISKDDRHVSKSSYWEFLKESWQGISPLLKEKAKIIVRIGGIKTKPEIIEEKLTLSLKKTFPGIKQAKESQISRIENKQSRSFSSGAKGCKFEIDCYYSLD